MFIRHIAPFRNLTDIGSAKKKLKEKRKIVFGGNPLLPIFIFHDHTTIIAAEAHYRTLYSLRHCFQEQYKGRK